MNPVVDTLNLNQFWPAIAIAIGFGLLVLGPQLFGNSDNSSKKRKGK